MNRQFGDLIASELYCPHCKLAQPVREQLLLVLLDGALYEYVCVKCGRALGKRTVTGQKAKPTGRTVLPRKH